MGKVNDKKNKLLPMLRKETFWNCDLKKMNYIDDKEIIIKRIIQSGTESDEIIMWKLYSYETIKDVAVNIDFLNRDRLIYISFVLDLEEKVFKCYKNNQFH